SVEAFRSPIFPLPNGRFPEQSFTITVEKPFILTCVGPSNVEFMPRQSQTDLLCVYHLKVPRQVAQVSLQLYHPDSDERCEFQLVTKALSWHLMEEREIISRNEPIQLSEQYLVERSGQLRVAVDSSNMQALTDRKSIEIT